MTSKCLPSRGRFPTAPFHPHGIEATAWECGNVQHREVSMPKEDQFFWERTPKKNLVGGFNHLEKYEPMGRMTSHILWHFKIGSWRCAILAVDDDYPDKTLLDHHPGLAYLLAANDVFPSRPLLSSKPTMIIEQRSQCPKMSQASHLLLTLLECENLPRIPGISMDSKLHDSHTPFLSFSALH